MHKETGDKIGDMNEKVDSVLNHEAVILEALRDREISDSFMRNTIKQLLKDAREEKMAELEEKMKLNGEF